MRVAKFVRKIAENFVSIALESAENGSNVRIHGPFFKTIA
jgi:hypothetical protein